MRHTITATLFASATLLVSPARAQDAAPAAEAAEEEVATPATDPVESGDQGNDIIVTATKREQTLQEIPVAVSVTTAETIERAQIRDLKDLSSVVPSLRVNQQASATNTNFIIRGFGNGANNPGIEPSVGVFVDGVYRSRSAAQIGDLPDIQRVEVLRGPQSTLFGKNASAGVISIVTREPKFTFGGNVEASYGNYNAIVVKGVVTGPLSDTIAASIAGGYNKRDGYVRDLGPAGGRVNARDRWFARGQVLFQPDDAFTFRVIADYSKIDEVCCAAVNLQRSAATTLLEALGGKVNDFRTPFADVVYNNAPSTNDIANYGISGQADYAYGPFKLTSITAYRRVKALNGQDSDFSSADLIGNNFQNVRLDTFTQELRLATDLNGPVNALIGAFYFKEKVKQFNAIPYGTQFRPYANLLIQGASGGALSVPVLEQTFGALEGNPAKYLGQFFAAGQGFTENYRLNNDAFSIFGQIDFEIADGLTLTGGLNYTHDKKRYRTNVVSTDVFSGLDLDDPRYAPFRNQLLLGGALAQGVPFAAAQAFANANQNNPAANPLAGFRGFQFLPPFQNVPNAVEPGKTNDSDFSYTARLAYDVNAHVNVYASYATGFKASSINLSRDSRPTPADFAAIKAGGFAVTNLTSGTRSAGPENSTVYELGLKANWGVVSLNFAAFKEIISGFQSNVFTGTGFVLANAGKESVKGFEFESQVRPIDPLTLTFALTYLDPTYDSFKQSALGDISGSTPASIPPLSVTFGASYDHEFAGGDHLILRGDFHHESDVAIAEGLPGFRSLGTAAAVAAARPFRRQVDDLNASLTYAMDNGLELSVWGRNLLDDRTIGTIFDSVGQQFSISGYPNQPRTYGVSARYRF
ncbi:TonB-dependent receptor [Novosphingobium sp. Gsoil 351]|uniref:TonB-dependent receptor n=1 Tax=Novosphingobium sp. Gsoil 351 TaxID=2675225 RepID=UPI0012B4F4C9|nr:TonB-dependent receptor [Novosphingobium sp. Gsoil 351]QGN55440.1 TonB-dependent receptor [Novosphingobium sp. Gsoil 351]